MIPIVTMTLARDRAEADVIIATLRALSENEAPRIFVTDGGSVVEGFLEELQTISRVSLVRPAVRGVTAQMRQSISAAMSHATRGVLYLESNKEWFVASRLSDFMRSAEESLTRLDDRFGVALPGRSPASFATYPTQQRASESAINHLISDLTARPSDFTFGPRLISKELLEPILPAGREFGWGWLSIPVVLAHRRSRSISVITMDLPCPEYERAETEADAAYRREQERQHREAIAWANNL
jgi:hypothetical protein